jgi:flagellar protein FlaG
MDIGSVRPALAGGAAPVPRAPGAAEQAVRTELPPPVAVTSADRAVAAAAERGPGQVGRPPAPGATRELSGEFVRDLRTKDLVFRWVDVASGDVVRQFPDEAVLRVRALIDAWTDGPPTGRTAAYDVTA